MKYRQPGYHDEEYKKERERKEGPRKPRGPREIATREARRVVRCFNCGNQTPPGDPIAPDAVCEKCRSDLHICRNCLHFDPGARWECRQTIPAPIRSKIARNDCPLFTPQAVLDATGRRAGGPPADARAAFDALFKKK